MPPGARPRRALWAVVAVTAAVPLGWGLAALIAWRGVEEPKAECQSNLRRLSSALLFYSQDFDGRLPPAETPVPSGGWATWIAALSPYLAGDDETCPANPSPNARDPFHGYPYPHSYALNCRFADVFAPGAFPIENLEIPAQTALVVESGSAGAGGRRWSLSWYWDAAWWAAAYPAPHGGRMNVAAADGHVVTVRPAYHHPQGHSALYGRLGASIYNWNAGHPNGDTAGAPYE